MQIFIPTGFANIVNSCDAELKKLLPFIEKYLGKTISDKFTDACKKIDYKTANKIMDNTIEKISGQESVSDALIVLVDKFPEFDFNFSGVYSDVDKIEYINQYADRMLEIIENERLPLNMKLYFWFPMDKKVYLLITLFIAALIVIILVVRAKKKKKTHAVKGLKKFHKRRKFTEADKDLILLIKNISAIYDKVDKC